MKNFLFDCSATELNIFSETKEEFVTIREIELVSEGLIIGEVIFVEERMKDGKRKYQLPMHPLNIISDKKVSLNHDIDNCVNTFLIPNQAPDRKYRFYYETLNDFLKNTEKEVQDNRSSYETEKNNWISNVDKLFQLVINNWFEGIPGSAITKVITRSEEKIGTYEIQQLVITLNNGKIIKLTPLATYIIGGYGRIDIEFPSGYWGSAMLILNKDEDKKGHYYWTIVEKDGKNVFEKSIRSDFTKGKFIKIIKDAFSI